MAATATAATSALRIEELILPGVFIVENLCNLAALGAEAFRFFAVPIKVRGAASMPIRAFGEVS